jgi:multidrug efflux system membrane fusion protein
VAEISSLWRSRRVVIGAGLGAAALLAFFLLRGASAPAQQGTADVAVPVTVSLVTIKTVPIYLDGIGTVQASNTVQIRSRVDGQILDVRFREGQEVKAGDVLVMVDPRPFEANLKQMEANLLRDKAQLVDAKAQLNRLIQLKDFASRQSVDTQRASVAQFEALVAADQAQVDYARTQLDYTTVRSPIDGRTGIRQIDVGNVVHAADTSPIVTVTQFTPIAVVFTLNADHLPVITGGTARGPLAVYAFAKDNSTQLAQGQLVLVDNQIDQATGTVKLKASFANADHRLWPGQFVNARLQVAVHEGLTVPATAVQHGPNGTYAWIIARDQTAQMQPVTVLQIQDGEALIQAGLEAGQRVVIDGQYKLQPGSMTAPAAGA